MKAEYKAGVWQGVVLYRDNLLLIGMMSCGMTGRTLLDPALSMSYTPCSARNA